MSVEKIQRDITNLFNYPSDPNPTTQADYINAVKNWVGSIVNLVDISLWQPETEYGVGNIVKTPSLPSQYFLECVMSGESGAVEPDYTDVGIGDTVADETVVWVVKSVTIVTDTTLTIAGEAADAKATGDRLTMLESYPHFEYDENEHLYLVY